MKNDDYFFLPLAVGVAAAAVCCLPNISARLFMPLVFTFFNASTPRLPFASSLRFFAAAAAFPPPNDEEEDGSSEEEVLEDCRPGR